MNTTNDTISPLYICLEGAEGTFKTTTAKALAEFYKARGQRVLLTKEPGSPLVPLTMQLRDVMLSNEYAEQLSPLAREYISQAIRSVHINSLIAPALKSGEWDVIIQDRGVMSGWIYAKHSLKNSRVDLMHILHMLAVTFTTSAAFVPYYTEIVVLRSAQSQLARAVAAKQEFATGDFVESHGAAFHDAVTQSFAEITEAAAASRSTSPVGGDYNQYVGNMINSILGDNAGFITPAARSLMAYMVCATTAVDVDGKTTEQIVSEITA